MSKEKESNLNYKEKDEQMKQYKENNTGPGKKMTSDSGFKISNDRWSLRAGKRGPLLLQGFLTLLKVKVPRIQQ